MKDLRSQIARRLLLFDKLHDVIMQERQTIVSGHSDRLAVMDAKKKRIMRAADNNPLDDIPGSKQDADTARMLALLREKIRAVIKESSENERILQQQMNAVAGELRSMKKDNRIRTAYQPSRSLSSIFIDDKK